CNEAFAQILGTSTADLIGKGMLRHFAPADRLEVEKGMKELDETEACAEVGRRVRALRRADGVVVDAELSPPRAVVFGARRCSVTIFRDLTAEREEQAREREREAK